MTEQTSYYDEKYFSVWGNLSTELIGIWLSVRLIEYAIRSHETSTKARVRTVRHFRGMERRLHRIVEYKSPRDLKLYYREYNWGKTIIKKRHKHFSPDEIQDISGFYSILDNILSQFPEIPDGDLDKRMKFSTSNIDENFAKLEQVRLVVERNILEETDEDEGI